MIADLDFAEVVDRFYGPLYRFALSLTGSEVDAADLVQETFYIWARKGKQLRDASCVKGWLFTAMHRRFLQSRRRAERFREVELVGSEIEEASVQAAGLERVDAVVVVALMQELDEVFRAPLALFYLEDMSYEEIAGTLGVPVGTVKSRLSRGVARLREVVTGAALKRGGSACD
jgi:RNA polymerase sigma factor (sigma-70 family)